MVTTQLDVEFERLVEAEIGLLSQQRSTAQELKKAERAAGEVLLRGGSTELGATAAVSELKARREAIERGLDTCRAKRPGAIRAFHRARAESLRAEAVALRKQLSAIKSKSQKLWAQISEIEEAAIGPEILGAVQIFQAQTAPSANQEPRSVVLQRQIEKLETAAFEEESADIPIHGGIDLEAVTDSETVIATVLRDKSTGPSGELVQRWLDECENSRPGIRFGSNPRRVYIRWFNGVIGADSYVFVAAMAPRIHGSMSFDIPAGTFRPLEWREKAA